KTSTFFFRSNGFRVINDTFSRILKKIKDRCLESAETEIQSGYLGFGEFVFIAVAVFSVFVNERSTWVRKAEEFCRFVKGFSRRVVNSLPKHFHFMGRFTQNNLRMSSAYQGIE